ncbi:ABC transporter ATP-binding protein [Desulfopila sp. IMCC35008]|uniref:ABC transporter ATP-binding protein n=1 Tax=Desulfopila sp. IMCC35008 TaxID=2653858 RepID=UPI0013D043EF|nr:ABC transporter ATP-binding protein [Desulfopila sp. IMCC35008]
MELELSNITHRYGDVTAIEGVDLTVREREVVALIGPSGCGKSTLLSIAGGLLAPSEGAVYQQGDVPEGCLNPLTYVFQDFALLPWRSVEGNIRLVLADHKLPTREREERITQVLEQTGLADFRGAYPRQLSGGMCQRVGIARALAVKPAVLLMDEPLSALDAQTRALLLEEFVDLFARLSISSLYVTHNLDEAVRLADRVVALSRRPGMVREVVDIPIPVAERKDGDPVLTACREQLWQLIRNEAIAADQELTDGS